MINGLVSTLTLAALFPTLVVLLIRKFRQKAFLLLPFSIIVNFGMVGVFAPMFLKLPFSTSLRFFVVWCVCGVFSGVFVYFLEKKIPCKKYFSNSVLAFLAILAVFSCVDSAYIFSKQGFSPELNNSYFRAPFNSDNERNLIIVNALHRDGKSPFFPDTQFSYQIFWHNIAVLAVSPLPSVFSRYGQVQGATLATGMVFFFSLFWMLFVFQPALRGNLWIVAGLFIVFCFHSDIYHFGYSMIMNGVPAIEADGSIHYMTMRNFSVKLMSITSPQHTLFFVFLSAFLVTQRLRLGSAVLEAAVFILAFLASPILSAMFFGLYFFHGAAEIVIRGLFLENDGGSIGSRFRKTVSGLIKYVGWIFMLLFSAWIAYQFVMKNSPVALFVRGAGGSGGLLDLSFGNLLRFPERLLEIPRLFAGTLGVQGIVVLMAVLANLYGSLRKRWRLIWDPSATILVLGTLGVYYYVNDTEVRRHFAIVAAFTALTFIVCNAVQLRRVGHKIWNLLLVALCVLSVGLEGYFMYCFTGKENVLAANVNWGDYFAMNRALEAKYPGACVLAAAGFGLRFPIAMEAATSFAMPADAVVHSKLNPAQTRFLQSSVTDEQIIKSARKIGYELIIWGPVEDKVWGRSLKEDLAKPGSLLERTGAVSLYRI